MSVFKIGTVNTQLVRAFLMAFLLSDREEVLPVSAITILLVRDRMSLFDRRISFTGRCNLKFCTRQLQRRRLLTRTQQSSTFSLQSQVSPGYVSQDESESG